MNTYIKIFLRKDFQKKDNTYPICLRLTLRRHLKVYSLNISTLVNSWDEKNQKVRKTDREYQKKNILIDYHHNKANKIIFDYTVKNQLLTVSEFDRCFKSQFYEGNSFYNFVENELKTLKDKFSKDTIRLYETQISKLKQFRPQLLLNEINIQFIKDYGNYMIVKLGNNQNTISKSLGFIRAALNKAIQAGIIEENPFKNFPLRSISGNREFLTKPELDKLEEIFLSDELPKNKKNILRYFLFCCYTGLRYGDVKALKYKNINEDIISIEMHKTKGIVRIPLIPQAKKLIEPGLKEQYVFKVFTDQPTNRYLKSIMKIAEIKKNISFHCARHTFATQGLNFGIPIEVISKLLGHTDLRTTQIYTQITDEYKIKELKKWEW